MKSYLIHYETAEGGHSWAIVECGGKLARSDRLTWFAVYEVPAQIHWGSELFDDPTWYLRDMARKGVLQRVAP